MDRYIVEVDETAAGVLVKEAGSYIFFASSGRASALDQKRFSSVASAERRIRHMLDGNARGLKRRIS